MTLTVNGSTPGGTLRSLGTVLANHSGTSAVGAEYHHDQRGCGLCARRSLDRPDCRRGDPHEHRAPKERRRGHVDPGQSEQHSLAGTSLRVIDGTMSIVGGGGTANPVSSVTTRIEIGGTTTDVVAGLAHRRGHRGHDLRQSNLGETGRNDRARSPGTDTISGRRSPLKEAPRRRSKDADGQCERRRSHRERLRFRRSHRQRESAARSGKWEIIRHCNSWEPPMYGRQCRRKVGWKYPGSCGG